MVFFWELWLWVFWPFPFLFLFSVGRESRQSTRFWLAIKGRGPLQVMVSFLSLFGCDYSVLFGYFSCPKTRLYNSFIFFRSLIRDFLFSFVFSQSLIGNFLFSFVFFRSLIMIFVFLLFSSNLWSGTFLFFFKRVSSSTVSDPSSEGKDGNSHPGSRFMVSWDFGSRLVERLDMMYVRVLVWPAV